MEKRICPQLKKIRKRPDFYIMPQSQKLGKLNGLNNKKIKKSY